MINLKIKVTVDLQSDVELFYIIYEYILWGTLSL